MEYYYTDGTTNYGPFTPEQLREKNITATTRVWHSGLSGWVAASEVPELASVITSTPPLSTPPPPSQTTQTTYSSPGMGNIPNKPPKTWLVESILVTLFCCLPFDIAGIIFASRVESKFYAGDYAGAWQASQDAGRWTRIGFFLGLAVLILYVIYIVWIVIWASNNGGDFEQIIPNF